MGLTYAHAIKIAFGAKEFHVTDFERIFAHPHAASALSSLVRRGLVLRLRRGVYCSTDRRSATDDRRDEWLRARQVILSAPVPKAWTGPTAVETWTRGRYRISPSPFTREFYIAVEKRRIRELKAYLRAHGVPAGGSKHIGARAVIVPVDKLDDVETLDGETVISLAKTKNLIGQHPGLYEGALAEIRAARSSDRKRRAARKRAT